MVHFMEAIDRLKMKDDEQFMTMSLIHEYPDGYLFEIFYNQGLFFA